jgi:hypothetical protein
VKVETEIKEKVNRVTKIERVDEIIIENLKYEKWIKQICILAPIKS